MSGMSELAKPKVLFSADEVRDRVEAVGHRITEDYADREIAMVGILPNSMVFMADLIRQVVTPLTCNFLQVFTEARRVDIAFGTANDFDSRDVLLVSGVVDTGITLNFISGHIQEDWKPRSLKVAALIDRQINRKVDCPVDYSCFELSQKGFVIGYGLAYQERFRGIPYLGIIDTPGT